MKVELITKEDLNNLKIELLSEISSLLSKILRNETPREKWLKGIEVRNMLGISTGTLQNMRLNGILPFCKIGGLIYYKYDDIVKLLDK